MRPTQGPPLRLAIVNDYEIVVRGLAAMLEPHGHRVQVIELDSKKPLRQPVDVVLYDSFSQQQADGDDIADVVASVDAPVVIFSWHTDESLVEQAFSKGVRGYVSKQTDLEGLIAALEMVRRGQPVRPMARLGADADGPGTWPGRGVGLSARESEMIALITQGFSNAEIATRSHLSINSVKTYIRTAYRKIGVTRRSQAVAWGYGNGFEPQAVRVLDPHGRG